MTDSKQHSQPDVSERDPGAGASNAGSVATSARSETIRAALERGRWTDREAVAALDSLVEQLETSQRRVAQLELDVDRLSRAYETGNA